MPSFDNDDDVFLSTGSRYLSAGPSGPRKSPSRQSLNLNGRRSATSLRAQAIVDEDAANGRHSLAHELAVALMPEPSAGSKLLAEEFGIEYDEGAEGIDGVPATAGDEHSETGDVHMQNGLNGDGPHGAEALGVGGVGGAESLASQLQLQMFGSDAPPEIDPDFRSPVASPTKPARRAPEQDLMTVLAQDLEYTDKFLLQLRRLDADHPQTASAGALEKLASEMIRHIDDSVRDREGQVRELLEYEREFRKIAAEVGGNDALGQVDELENLVSDAAAHQHQRTASIAETRPVVHEQLDAVVEEANASADWEVDPDRQGLGDDEEEEEDYAAYNRAPAKVDIPALPPINGPPTPAYTISHLAHFRTFTASTATSLATMSEHTQVNAAATTEAGRKIRALKNKLGGWKTEWDSAEKSRLKIEKWEAGLDFEGSESATPVSPPRSQISRRIDGRKLVQEHLQAFELALAEANTRTQAIIAAVS